MWASEGTSRFAGVRARGEMVGWAGGVSSVRAGLGRILSVYFAKKQKVFFLFSFFFLLLFLFFVLFRFSF
jgi:uncharacterized membrane protein